MGLLRENNTRIAQLFIIVSNYFDFIIQNSYITQEQVRSLLSFQEWTECFHIFIAIYIQKYPEEAPHLLKYMSTIKGIHEMKEVVAFHYYDLRFRVLRKGNRQP